MGTTAQDNLRLDVPDNTLDDNTWGTLLNTLLSEMELAITGVHAVTITSADHTLDVTGGLNDRARRAIIMASGTLTGNFDIIAPAEPKIYIVRNKTTGAFTLGIKVNGQVRVNIPQDDTLIVFCDGTDFFQINALVSGTVAKATDADTLITIAGANFGQLAVKNQWTKPQILLGTTPALDVTGDPNEITPDADSDTNILIKQSEMMRNTNDVKFMNPIGTPIDGQVMVFTVEQRSATPSSVQWDTAYKFPDDVAIALTQTVDKIDAFSFMYNSNVTFWLNFGTALNIPRA